MRFKDRTQVGRLLARRLRAYRGKNPLVLAIPSGGVPVGRRVADLLEGEFDVALVQQLSAPGNPRLILGYVSEGGHVDLRPFVDGSGIGQKLIEEEIRAQTEMLRRRREIYSPRRSPPDPARRTVIVVDDGGAAGTLLMAVLRAVRARRPRKVIVGVPVSPSETLSHLGGWADEVVCLYTPLFFGAIRRFYENFSMVTDDEVVEGLRGPPVSARKPSVDVH
jgi:putative phosphoribosyl transferase